MDPSKKLNISLIAAGAIVVIATLGVVAYFFFAPASQTAEVRELDTSELDTGPDVAAQVSGAVETPAEKLPETNPFGSYKNPFE